MNWIKKGNIFNKRHAQLPVAILIEDKVRVFYSTRLNNQNVSVPMYVDLNPNDLTDVLHESEQILATGRPGFFDYYGVMPTCILKKDDIFYMYYIGWGRRLDVPYHNSLGLAVSHDGTTWKKYSEGPVFTSSAEEPGYIGTADVHIENGIWKMWYLSCREWITHNSKMEPVYDIKYATSFDGISWNPISTAINLNHKEGGMSAARVVKNADGYEMYFSVRNYIDYRENTRHSYRIKKATSSCGVNWERHEDVIIDTSDEGWDDFMTCYPFLLDINSEHVMFYNGNGFGKTGIGYAIKK